MKKYLLGAVLSLGLLFSPVLTQAAPLSDTQIQSILSILSAFGVENATIVNVKAALTGNTASFSPPSSTACTADAKQCPDGSYVGRTGSRCEFVCASSAPTPGTVQPKPRVCNALYRNLSRGVQGDDVRSLQEFLRSEKILSAEATGFFGSATSIATARWQAAQGIESAGVVGPLTRERIKMVCDGGTNPPVACTLEYNPVCGSKPIVCITTPCNPISQTYGNRCALKADGASFLHEGQCRPNDPTQTCTVRPACLDATPRCLLPEPSGGWCSSDNKSPVISGFSGPTTLAVGVSGTWMIRASDPENQQLSYRVSWGDESTSMNPGVLTTMNAAAFVQTTTFTHAYQKSGVYTITILVRDSGGKEEKTSTTVRVGSETGVICTAEYAPVCGQPKWSCPAGMMCAAVMPAPKTYSNRCAMNAEGATFISSGECSNTTY